MILSKYCQILQHLFIKRFTLMDPILIMLLNLFRQNSTFKSGGPGTPEIKVGGLGPCRPPVPPPMLTKDYKTHDNVL